MCDRQCEPDKVRLRPSYKWKLVGNWTSKFEALKLSHHLPNGTRKSLQQRNIAKRFPIECSLFRTSVSPKNPPKSFQATVPNEFVYIEILLSFFNQINSSNRMKSNRKSDDDRKKRSQPEIVWFFKRKSVWGTSRSWMMPPGIPGICSYQSQQEHSPG